MKNLLNNNRANIASRIYAPLVANITCLGTTSLPSDKRLAELARMSLHAADIFIAEADAQESDSESD